jgi:hypothetical protein
MDINSDVISVATNRSMSSFGERDAPTFLNIQQDAWRLTETKDQDELSWHSLVWAPLLTRRSDLPVDIATEWQL